MSGTIVTAYLFRVTGALTLTHPSSPTTRLRLLETMAPAVLVIPRSGGVRDPYVVIQAGGRAGWGNLSHGVTSLDVHVRAHLNASHSKTWQEVADVLVCQRVWPRLSPERMAHLFDRFPGCDVLVGRRRTGCLLGMRDGGMVAVTAPAIFPAVGATAWPAVYGSVLHCWLTSGVSLSTVEDATVIAGHVDAAIGGLNCFAVAARTRVSLIRQHKSRGDFIAHPFSC
jgi:hypothetical protein